MSTEPTPTQPTVSPEKDPKIQRIKTLAWVLDAQFRIPFTDIRFGIDPILSLIPLAGPIATFVVSAFLVYSMQRNGASSKVFLLMLWNILLDVIMSSFPVVGSLFDVGYKANNRNVDLLLEHYEEGKHQGSAWTIIIIILISIFAVIFGVLYGVWALLSYGWGLLVG
ncbi:MAG: DUF4112 domain-containing protein [Bacteroidota bacterium]